MNNKKILILSVHPDDEVISFGGLISHEISLNHEVYVHLFTLGGPCSNVPSEVRLKEFKEVMDFLKVTKYTISGIDLDGRLDQLPNCELTSMIDNLVNEIKPDEVYCSSNSEHSDHNALYRAFLGATRIKSGFQPKLWAVGTYMFSDQTLSSFDGGKMFQPLNERDFNNKCEAFKLYKSQFKPSPSPLGIDGLRIMAEYYGMLCGVKYAELYYQLKYIRCI